MFSRTIRSMSNAKKNDLLVLVAVAVFLVAGICVSGTRLAGMAFAGEADVIDVVAVQESAGMWRFDVTVAHGDEGWDHYADRWDVLAPGGSVLGERVLLHPHVNEQPFTRSLRGVSIPDDIVSVVVRAHDSSHGFGGKTVNLDLPR